MFTGAPAGTRSLAPLPFQLILPREHLLGDWYDTRTWLEDHGITPTLTFVTDSLGNPTGGTEQGFTTANNVGLDLNFDLEKIAGLEGGSLLFSMSYRFGGSLSANYIHNIFTVQQVFGGETFRVVNIAYLQKLLDDRVEIRLGRIATGDDFLVSPYNYVFVQNGFDGNPVGLAVVYGHFSDDLEDFQGRSQQLDPNVGVQSHETVLELTYRMALLNSALYIQPDLQYVFRPGGTGRIPDALVLGAQVAVNF